MTAGQHDHEDLRAEIADLKTQLQQAAQAKDTATQEAAQAAASAQQAAEVAVTESAVTRADLEGLRDELMAAIADAKSTPAAPEPPAAPVEPEPSGVPAAPADLPDPPAGEGLEEGAQDTAEPVEKKDTKNHPPRKRKSVWWG